MVVDELDHRGYFPRRSSSAWAKYADAFRRISFARVSSRTSRSSSCTRSRSLVVRPGRCPASRCACRTHFPSNEVSEKPVRFRIPVRVGRRGPHFSGPSAGVTLRDEVRPSPIPYRVANWPAPSPRSPRRCDVWLSSQATAAWTPRRSGRRVGSGGTRILPTLRRGPPGAPRPSGRHARAPPGKTDLDVP